MKRSDTHLPRASAKAKAHSRYNREAPAPRRLGGWPRRWRLSVIGAAILLTIFALGGGAAAQKKDSCVACHAQMEGTLAAPVQLVKSDVHGARGFSCVDCHRGDASQDEMGAAMDPKKGFIGKPRPQQVPEFCGKCHSNAEQMKAFAPALRIDQEREYLTSVHGKRLQSGDVKVATCISCHGNHGIRAINDPQSSVYAMNVAETCSKCHANADYMQGYAIPNDQFIKYKTSVHAKALYERQDLSAPTCNDCHGNHGAAPPGLASVANVCGQCHIRQATLFAASPHKVTFDAMQVGECIACHNNHDISPASDEMLGVGDKSVCNSCHGQGEDAAEVTGKMRAAIDQLAANLNRSTEILNRAERAGMEVSRAKFDLNEAHDSLTHARVVIHSFSNEELSKVVEPGLATSAKGYAAGEAALAELRYRRQGLAASLFFILFLAAVVYLKVRQIEGRPDTLNE